MKESTKYKIPKDMQGICEDIHKITDKICNESLDEEYLQLCRKLAAKIARKRPSPLLYGNPELWASAIICCIAEINFLFDKTQKPHITKQELFSLLPSPKNTIIKYRKTIWQLLDLCQLDPEFTRPSKMNDNPFAWMVSINGFITDIRTMPMEYQEIAYRKGLIPYIPKDPSIE